MNTPKVLRSDLSKVYRDPLIGPRDLLAYCPELHASSKCERAIRKGRRMDVSDLGDDNVWCELCTVTDPEQATIRLIDGEWREADDNQTGG